MVEHSSEDSVLNTSTDNHLDDQYEDYALKARKPYTITKQREKWTQEDHKFLEALKLYGRAWPQIEEHVGNKTAIQIRSHAQKFFTKVVRESNIADGIEATEHIEIPPPRAKRKPTRPYPRKVLIPSKKESRFTSSPSSQESLSTQSVKLFGTTVYVNDSISPSSANNITTLPGNSMTTRSPECPTTILSLNYLFLQSSEQMEEKTQCYSQDVRNCVFGSKAHNAMGFVPYKICLAEKSAHLLRLCL
ncbi:uncharacterized protein [Rutidosis leptorrhynchoides]|uniref:uncharacterized protein n=1 Tax=Rutidosis leptorrhynchoides TaxID=125765 RepID=UPI003A9978AB